MTDLEDKAAILGIFRFFVHQMDKVRAMCPKIKQKLLKKCIKHLSLNWATSGYPSILVIF